jgi:hypothetical protein
MVDYPQLTEPDIYGTSVGEQNSIEIVEDFTATLRISQILGGVENMNKFYTGYPVKVEYIFKNPDDTPTLPDNAKVTYKIGSGSEIELKNPTNRTDAFSGYYTYMFTPTQAGSYTFKGIATKGTFKTIPDVTSPYLIEQDSVIIEPDLNFNPVNKVYDGILTFDTFNVNKQLISTSNVVDVYINGVKSGTVQVNGDGGQYSIDYTFTKLADYKFTITSSPTSGNLVSGEFSTQLIKVGEVEENFCESDSECGLFGVCNVGVCETNVILVITVVLGGLIGIVILIIAIKFIKNKKKTPSFGGGIGGL